MTQEKFRALRLKFGLVRCLSSAGRICISSMVLLSSDSMISASSEEYLTVTRPKLSIFLIFAVRFLEVSPHTLLSSSY